MSSKSSSRIFLRWFLIGTAFAAILQFGQGRVMGGVPEGLLFVGSLEPVHEIVVDELPRTPISPGSGHDGQIFYAMGLDLRGDAIPEVMGSAGYRYRRILFPALASAFGLLEGQGLLWGMIVITALSVGLATGSAAALAARLELPTWVAAGVLINPGVWLSARLLTADILAFSLALLAVLAFSHKRYGWTVAGLALAALTKEPYLAFALGLSGYMWSLGYRRRGLGLGILSVVPMSAWWAYVALEIGNPLTSGSQTVAPFVGLIDATGHWSTLRARDIFYLGAIALGILLALWLVTHLGDLWSWLVAPWLLIAVFAAEAVWQFGNNAIRAFAPILTLSIVGVASRSIRRAGLNAREPTRTGSLSP